MTADVCWQTETRAMRLAKDAEYVREFLAGFTPKTATEMIDKLSLDECAALVRARRWCFFEEFSKVWGELPDMPAPPIYRTLSSTWETKG